MELRLGAQYNFMSFSLQEEGGWRLGEGRVECGGEGGGERGRRGGGRGERE